MSSDNPGQSDDFRSRLAGIPRLEEEPLEPAQNPRGNAVVPEASPYPVVSPAPAAPVVSRAAPVARPMPRRQVTEATESADADIDEFFGDDPGQGGRHEEEADGEWPVGGRRRRRWPLVLVALILIAALAVIIPLYRARQVFNEVERVSVAQVLSPAPIDGVNILLVGTDSRDGIDGSTDNFGLIAGTREGDAPIAGERSDTIMILRLQEDGTARFLSLPRDLWLPINGGGSQRINTAFAGGPTSLINTVQMELGVPISHYVQVDLVGFIDLVDAVGGVELSIAHPAFDTRSGLDLPNAGPNMLDSTQALAYVRSRFYTERINGEDVVDGTSDIGRVQRQQWFMQALFAKVSTQRDPRILNSMGTAMADAIVIDDATTLTDAVEIANTLRSITPESVVLPTRNATVGNASVLELTDEAPAVLAQFGAG